MQCTKRYKGCMMYKFVFTIRSINLITKLNEIKHAYGATLFYQSMLDKIYF
jgi:hypothetical protein